MGVEDSNQELILERNQELGLDLVLEIDQENAKKAWEHIKDTYPSNTADHTLYGSQNEYHILDSTSIKPGLIKKGKAYSISIFKPGILNTLESSSLVSFILQKTKDGIKMYLDDAPEVFTRDFVDSTLKDLSEATLTHEDAETGKEKVDTESKSTSESVKKTL